MIYFRPENFSHKIFVNNKTNQCIQKSEIQYEGRRVTKWQKGPGKGSIQRSIIEIYICRKLQYFTAKYYLWTGNMITTNKVIHINKFISVIHQKTMQEKII